MLHKCFYINRFSVPVTKKCQVLNRTHHRFRRWIEYRFDEQSLVIGSLETVDVSSFHHGASTAIRDTQGNKCLRFKTLLVITGQFMLHEFGEVCLNETWKWGRDSCYKHAIRRSEAGGYTAEIRAEMTCWFGCAQCEDAGFGGNDSLIGDPRYARVIRKRNYPLDISGIN